MAGAVLIVLGGLAGAGKSAIARELAREIGAAHVRIDSIEQALREAIRGPMDDSGYRVAYAVAEDNLRAGRAVIADCVNPIEITREAWLAVARRAGADVVEVEIRCSDAEEHRSRVEGRSVDVPGLALPTWDEVVSREYEPWPRAAAVDTAGRSVAEGVAEVRRLIGA